MIPDGLLATGAVWPVYPPVAESLGLVGSYVWRTPDGELLGLREFVRRTLGLLAPLDPRGSTWPPSPHDPRVDRYLGAVPDLAAVGGPMTAGAACPPTRASPTTSGGPAAVTWAPSGGASTRSSTPASASPPTTGSPPWGAASPSTCPGTSSAAGWATT